MSKEEPAWRAELREAIRRWDEWEIEAPLRMQGGLLDTLIPHIEAAEQRGRQQALSAVGAEIEVMLEGVSALQARTVWKSGYEGALTALSVTLDSIMPDKP